MRRTLILILVGVLCLFTVACGKNQGEKSREASVSARNDTLARAESIAPLPYTSNFPIRRALVKFTERQDLLDHPWYVYILSDLGSAVGYYVGQTYPINICNFLSSTEDVETKYEGTVVLTAPSLDGIYYGGSGATAGCDAWFFFDAATDAMIVIRGINFFVADQPLALDAEPIQLATPEVPA
jgi:hypothetical protein